MKQFVIDALIDLKCRVPYSISDGAIEFIKQIFDEHTKLKEENKKLEEILTNIERYVVNNSNLDSDYILKILKGSDK